MATDFVCRKSYNYYSGIYFCIYNALVILRYVAHTTERAWLQVTVLALAM